MSIDQTTPAAFERWRTHVASLEARFHAEAEQLAGDLTTCDAELTRAMDVDAAERIVERRDRAQRRLEAVRVVRRNVLGAAREAAAEAGRRDDSIKSVRLRLEHAAAVAEGTPASDERSRAERDVAFLRERLAELEQLEADDVARLELEAPAGA